MKFYHRLLPKKVLFAAYNLKIKLLRKIYRKIYFFKIPELIIRPNTTDEEVFHEIFITKELRLNIQLDPKLIIDCGAYVGYSSLYFTKQYPNAVIYSIEPETSNFSVLVENTKSSTNIRPINSAVWSEAMDLKIERGKGEWSFEVKPSTETNGSNIKSVTIDSILLQSGFSEIDILKIDIEGAELDLFSKNYENWLSKVKVLIIELHDRYNPGCTEAFYNATNKIDWIEYKKGEKVILIRK